MIGFYSNLFCCQELQVATVNIEAAPRRSSYSIVISHQDIGPITLIRSYILSLRHSRKERTLYHYLQSAYPPPSSPLGPGSILTFLRLLERFFIAFLSNHARSKPSQSALYFWLCALRVEPCLLLFGIFRGISALCWSSVRSFWPHFWSSSFLLLKSTKNTCTWYTCLHGSNLFDWLAR